MLFSLIYTRIEKGDIIVYSLDIIFFECEIRKSSYNDTTPQAEIIFRNSFSQKLWEFA